MTSSAGGDQVIVMEVTKVSTHYIIGSYLYDAVRILNNPIFQFFVVCSCGGGGLKVVGLYNIFLYNYIIDYKHTCKVKSIRNYCTSSI